MNLYEELLIDRSFSIDEIQDYIFEQQRIWTKRTNAPTLEKRQEAEKKIALLLEAESIFCDEISRARYDAEIDAEAERIRNEQMRKEQKAHDKQKHQEEARRLPSCSIIDIKSYPGDINSIKPTYGVKYSGTIDKSNASYVFFEVYLAEPYGIEGEILIEVSLYDINNQIVEKESARFAMLPHYSVVMKGVNIRNLQSGIYNAEIVINGKINAFYKFKIYDSEDVVSLSNVVYGPNPNVNYIEWEKTQNHILDEANSSNYIEAYKIAMRESERGIPEAQLLLGVTYNDGTGTNRDFREAFAWWQISAQGGCLAALICLADCYIKGKGVRVDFSKAVFLLNEGAKRGEPTCQYLLGKYYAWGQYGLSLNVNKGIELMKKAAERGKIEAYNDLGNKYSELKDVPNNEQLAFMNFKKAADAGMAVAMWSVAQSYRLGLGTPIDDNLAVKYYLMSYNGGCKRAKADLDTFYVCIMGKWIKRIFPKNN